MTWHFIPPGPWLFPDFENFDFLMSNWWATGGFVTAAPAFWQYESASLVQTIANYLPAGSTLASRILLSFLHNVFGSASAPSVPQNACPVVRLMTQSPFRRATGRFYFPGFSSTFLQGDSLNLIKPTVVPDFLDTWRQLPAVLADAYAPNPPPIWVVWLRRRQTGGPLAMPVVAPVTDVLLSSRQLRSQRLRLQGQRRYDLVPE